MTDLNLIKIDKKSRSPIYQQIVDSVIHNISIGNFAIDQKIPSINSLSEEFLLSRDTVAKAYNILKDRNIIKPVRRKGYYISKVKLITKVNILFMVNKMSSYKMKTYNSFLNTIGGNAHTDLLIYHCNESLFLNLLENNKKAYDYYIIMPHFKSNDLRHKSITEKVRNAINQIPEEKLLILDNNSLGFNEKVIKIYQDFENDIYYALKEGLSKIEGYEKLILVYPDKSVYPYPKRILHGFRKFCIENHIEFIIIEEVYEDIIIKRGDLFITIEEYDLVSLVKQVRENEFVLGKEIGIISYNDTPLKQLLGITVISTDFKKMGEKASSMILNNEKGNYKVPFNFIDRESI